MSAINRTTFVTDRTEYNEKLATGETVLLTAALHLPEKVKEIADFFRSIARQGERVNILNTIAAWRDLRNLRKEYVVREQEAHAALMDTVERLGQPVEGNSTLEIGWVQSFTLAAGLSAHMNLQTALHAASEVLDRKSAYAIACFSFYLAVVSLLVTLVLGVLSLT